MSPSLPARPNLEHLRKQAKALLKACRQGDPQATARLRDTVPRLAGLSDDELRRADVALHDAQLAVARVHGFKSWSALHDRVSASAQQAIAKADRSRAIPTAANNGNLEALEIALSKGDPTQHDLDLALARAAMHGHLDVAKRLLEHGADVNGEYGGRYGPIILAACEVQNPTGLRFLIDHGANVNFSERTTSKYPTVQTPLSMVLGTYHRGGLDRKHQCIDILIAAGAEFEDGPVMDIHRGSAESLSDRLGKDSSLIHRRVNLPYGNHLSLHGVTLPHVAAEFNERACLDVLLRHGADLNAPAEISSDGLGGQTPIFHTIATIQGSGYDLFEHLLTLNPDLSVRAQVQENASLYEKPQDGWRILTVTPLGYAMKFENEPDWCRATREIARLRERNAPI
ncbi:MAG: ankyrin repeat domain-containing protein [Phycisphaeraceae bacterium]|nr:ankyrin repeat domain-containing protein [Phycisphaeraceae bacterium]